MHKAMCDNFDTPNVMKALKSVVSDTYSYLRYLKLIVVDRLKEKTKFEI